MVSPLSSHDHQLELFAATDASLGASLDEKDACVWAMDLLCTIQAHLNAPPTDDCDRKAVTASVRMRLRLFCRVVIVRSGYDRLAGRLDMFPEALLHVVSQLSVWGENETRVCVHTIVPRWYLNHICCFRFTSFSTMSTATPATRCPTST